jgi:putative ABC transport system permease protein
MRWPSGGVAARFQQDARYGLRLVRKNPGFSAIVILTLAIGMGATTALFSVLDSVFLRPLPYPAPERLVMVWEKPPGGIRNSAAPGNFLDWRAQNRVFSSIAAVAYRDLDLSVQGTPEKVLGMKASAEIFDVFGVKPLLGRFFAAADDRPGAPMVAVLSYAAWQRRFGADPRILGQAVTINRERCVIVGVLPRQFRFPSSPEVWVPLALDPTSAARDFHYLSPVARLKPGVSFNRARAEMDGIARNIARAYPKSNHGWGVSIVSFRETLTGDEQRGVLVLFGAVSFVLMIACVNVANLLLARAASRRRELAVRASLGAGRARLMAQVLTESVILSGSAGVLGLLLASWLVRLSPALLPQSVATGIPEIGIDWRVLWFTLALSLGTGLLFGIVPAWRASAVNLSSELKDAGRSATSGSAGSLRNMLVVAETALSLALLAGAGLMVRSLVAYANSDPGFRPEHVLTMRLSMAAGHFTDGAQIRAFDRALLDRVSTIPGVYAASIATDVPLQGFSIGLPFQLAARPELPAAERPGAPFVIVSHDYFHTLGITVRRGRSFTGRDDENAPRVAVVNDAFVKKYLPSTDPVGQRLLVAQLNAGKPEFGPQVAWEIVGVVSDAKFGGLEGDHVLAIYVPQMQCPWPGGVLAVRTALDPARAVRAVVDAVRNLDREMPVGEIKTMEEIASESLSHSRLQTSMVGAFAAFSLLLAAFGIYGVMSYAASATAHEMGIRLALGAERRDLVALLLGRGMKLAGTGLAIGLAAAFGLTRLLRSLLYGVKPTDLVTYAVITLLLAAVAGLASYIPARRASKVDPMSALRRE